MILLILVVVLWAMVLAPSLYRRFSERASVGSIDHFHHELNLLEHAGPKLVNPAYRLHTALPGGTVDVPAEPERPMYRANLVLLRPVDDGEHADIDDIDGVHYERVGVFDPPDAPVSAGPSASELRAYRRQEARRRRANLLLVLAGLTLTTGVLGLLPTFRLAWILTALFGVALLALVGLIAYARELQGQTARWTSPAGRAELEELEAYEAYGASLNEAASGYPGAWDDEDDFPRQAIAGS